MRTVPTVTLIGERLAEVGQEFVYRGEAPGCAGCPYRAQCLNLDTGTRYHISSVRESANVLPCAVHDEGVRAVEVEPATVMANVPEKQAYSGGKTSLAGDCPYVGCPSHEYCVPPGIDTAGEYRVEEVVGDPPHDHCMLGRDLTLVELAPTDGK